MTNLVFGHYNRKILVVRKKKVWDVPALLVFRWDSAATSWLWPSLLPMASTVAAEADCESCKRKRNTVEVIAISRWIKHMVVKLFETPNQVKIESHFHGLDSNPGLRTLANKAQSPSNQRKTVDCDFFVLFSRVREKVQVFRFFIVWHVPHVAETKYETGFENGTRYSRCSRCGFGWSWKEIDFLNILNYYGQENDFKLYPIL